MNKEMMLMLVVSFVVGFIVAGVVQKNGGCSDPGCCARGRLVEGASCGSKGTNTGL
tara:strand:- start:344 stop:511 length:168 start_codon:yes stop_codon:yes gene_type:complete